MDKMQLRTKFKDLRDSLGADAKLEMEEAIHILSLKKLSQFDSIGIYYSFGNELNTLKLIESLLDLKKQIYLPRVEGNRIVFCHYKRGDILESSNYGIKEPINKSVSVDVIDVIVTPMLAFNRQGYRLGYGGGFYDRLLKNYKGSILGLAYDYSLSNDIPIERHDVRCHQIITDREVKIFYEI